MDFLDKRMLPFVSRPVSSAGRFVFVNRNVITCTMSSCRSKTPVLLSAEQALDLWKSGNKVKFIDGSFHMNKNERNAAAEYVRGHLPGARYIDIDSPDFADKSVDLPHMMPSEATFSASMDKFGISNDDHVIIYACPGSFGAPRIWWMFNTFGHQKVSILNGGLNAWVACGGPLEEGEAPPDATPPATPYVATLDPNKIASWQEVLSVVHSGAAQIVDARASARFLCKAPEPRPGLPSGHIPGSLNLPFTSVVQPDDFTIFRSVPEMAAALENAGLIRGSDIIASCGSGVTASVLVVAMHAVGGYSANNLKVYDGSWTEWGSREDLPKVTEVPDPK